MRTRIKGKWGESEDSETHQNIFDFGILEIDATMNLRHDNKNLDSFPIKINFNDMTIENKEKSIEEFYAIDAVDTAELKYFILQPDVALIEHDGSAKVQAKLKSLEEEDINSNGKGVT